MLTDSMAPSGVSQVGVPTPGVPSLLVAGFVLALVKAGLKVAGFSRVLRLVRARTDGVTPHSIGDEQTVVVGADRVVATAAAVYPGRALCLEQSLVLYYFLRRAGINAQFRLGVQPYPFEGHAWVECDGRPVNDLEEHVRHFTPFAEVAS